MRTVTSLLILALLSMTVATAQQNTPATRPAADVGGSPDDIQIEIALFGSGTHLADVTDRVVQLLHSEPQGFVARADWLRIDPAPGQSKSLLIRYRYHGKQRHYMISGGVRATFAAMMDVDDKK
ncbi:MAG TPA: hypothetical protein VH370_19390 [Humisphaera sp.]|jgi:hypothetical protein|nr:hypothetical protein [Humisphaera sp.]